MRVEFETVKMAVLALAILVGLALHGADGADVARECDARCHDAATGHS